MGWYDEEAKHCQMLSYNLIFVIYKPSNHPYFRISLGRDKNKWGKRISKVTLSIVFVIFNKNYSTYIILACSFDKIFLLYKAKIIAIYLTHLSLYATSCVCFVLWMVTTINKAMPEGIYFTSLISIQNDSTMRQMTNACFL